MLRYESWGRYPKVQQSIKPIYGRQDDLNFAEIGTSLLPYGLGRSYGDSCLNDNGTLLVTTGLDRFISFDRERGILRVEAGISLAEILKLVVPQGWFLAVTPGTKFVTIGGAIANDVHGKNHHRAGTFGSHLLQFELLRSSGERLLCSPIENSELFRATIGGLGLAGLILWAEIQLKKIENPFIDAEMIRFANLDEFFEISAESDQNYEHTVAWVDCLSKGESIGRGIFIQGNHAADSDRMPPLPKKRSLLMPIDAPNFMLNSFTIKAFNLLYYNKQLKKVVKNLTHYDPFFYPLDAIEAWNRIYGKRGFLQYQFVVPYQDNRKAIKTIFEKITDSGQGSFLAVLKTFGNIPSAGMMSFPKKGVILALDFPNRGKQLFDLLDQIDEIIRENGGAVYPAKDARMSARNFQAFFPQWIDFTKYIDPKFSSTFWRRVSRNYE